MINDDKPKYEFNKYLRAKGWDKPPSNEGITVIKIDEHLDKKVWCPICKHSMYLEEQLDLYICSNDGCANMLQTKLGDVPLHEEEILHTSNDPYGNDLNKPTFVHVEPEYNDEEYENLGRDQDIFETAEEAMSEKRVKRGTNKQRLRT